LWVFSLTSACCFSEPRKDPTGSESVGLNEAEEVRPPLPVIRETLYDDAMLYGYVFLYFIYFFFVRDAMLYY